MTNIEKPVEALEDLIGEPIVVGDDLLIATDVDPDELTIEFELDDGEIITKSLEELADDNEDIAKLLEELGEESDGEVEQEEEEDEPVEDEGHSCSSILEEIGSCLAKCLKLISGYRANAEDNNEETEETNNEEKEETMATVIREGTKVKALYDGEWVDAVVVEYDHDNGLYTVEDDEGQWEVTPDEIKRVRSRKAKTAKAKAEKTSSSSRRQKPEVAERMEIIEELGLDEGVEIKFKSKRAKKWHRGEVTKVYTSASKFKGFILVEDEDGEEHRIDPRLYNIKVM